MTALPRRLARMEKLIKPGATICLWQDAGTDIVAVRFPQGVPEGTTVIVYCWAIDSQLASPQPVRMTARF